MKTQVNSSLTDGVNIFGMHFPRSNCKMLRKEWVGSKPNHVPVGDQVDEADRFGYLRSCILPDVPISDELSSCMLAAWLGFTNSRPF